ncbi:MAG: helix-turn-helix domain-containing protein [Chloroflexota bacterium]
MNDNHLNDLGFRLLAPSPQLRLFVRSFWYFASTTPLQKFREEYMHPGGGWGIIFNLGDRLYLDGEPVTDPVFLDGTNTISRKMGFAGRIELIGIRFSESGAYSCLGLPLHYLKNETAILDSTTNLNLLHLYARLYETPILAMRIKLLEGWILKQLTVGRQCSPLIPQSLTLLRHTNGAMSIPIMAQELAVSQRHLERLFLSQVGMSPKQYSCLLRIEAARLALRQYPTQTTTELAFALGYYDQSHFIREFKAVVGVPPNTYKKRRQSG